MGISNAFEYVKYYYERYISAEYQSDVQGLLDPERNPFETIRIFKKMLADIIIRRFGNAAEAARWYSDHYGDEAPTRQTIRNWKRGK